MYGCDSWTIKKAEHGRIDAFELWCWRRVLRVPWTAKRSNQSILKEISPEYYLEGLILKLKLQSFSHLMQTTDPFEKTLLLGKIEGRRRRDDRGWDSWLASLTQWTWVWVNSGSWWWTGRSGVLQSMGSQSQTRLSDWTELNEVDFNIYWKVEKGRCKIMHMLFLFFFLTVLLRYSWYKKMNIFNMYHSKSLNLC